MNASERRHLIALINNYAQERGNPLLHSVVGTLLPQDSIASGIRKQYTQLSTLLDELAPEITQFQDVSGAIWVRSNNMAFDSHQQDILQAGYPFVIDADDVLIDSDIQKMHAFSFMGWWSNTYKQLKNLTGFSGNDYTIWTRIIARQFAIASKNNGLKECTFEGPGGTQRICLFRTGLKTPAGDTIVAVLQANATTDRQPWFFKEYTYAGDTQSEYGMWLLNNVDESFLGQPLVNRSIHIWKILDRMKKLHAPLQNGLERLKGGYLLPQAHIDAIKDYLDEMAILMRSGPLDWIELPDPMACNISELAIAVCPKQVLTTLGPMEDALLNLLALVQSMVAKLNGRVEKLDNLRTLLLNAGQSIREGGSAEEHLESYKGWNRLFCHAARTFFLKDSTHSADVCGELGITAFVLDLYLNAQAGSPEEASAAEEAIAQAESCMAEFEQSIETTASAAPADPPVPLSFNAVDEDDMPDLSDEMPEPFDLPEATDAPDMPDDPIAGVDILPTAPSMEPVPEESAPTGPVTMSAELDFDLDFLDDNDAVNDAVKQMYSMSGSIAAPAAPVRPATAPESITGQPERIELIRGMDNELQAQCSSGALDPEEETLHLGDWTLVPAGDPAHCTSELKALAHTLLTEPAARTEENLYFCIQEAFRRSNTAMARALLHAMPDGWRRQLCSFLLLVRTLAESTYPGKRLTILSNELPTALNTLLQTVRMQTAAVQTEVALTVLAHVPMIAQKCFHPAGVVALLDILDAPANAIISELGMSPLLRALHTQASSVSDIFKYVDITDSLQKMQFISHRESSLARLKAEGQRLTTLFSTNSISHKNSRYVVRGFATDKQPRTNRMLQCLAAGVPDPSVIVFADDDEMRSYINSIQFEYFPGNLADITGAGMAKCLDCLRQLNNAYRELQELNDTAGIPEELQQPMARILSILRSWPNELIQPINNQLKRSPLKEMLSRLCNSATLPQREELAWRFERTQAESWPMWEEDSFLAALAELAEVSLESRDVSFGMFDDSLSCADLPRLREMLSALQTRCKNYCAHLTDLINFNTIDQAEFKALIESLSKTHGWLERLVNQLEAAADDPDGFRAVLASSLPLMRYELNIWYADQRISSIYDAVAESARKLVVSSGEADEAVTGQLLQDIDDAVAQRNIQALSDRFMDSFTDVTKLRPHKNPAERFFSQDVQNTLYALGLDKNEDWCRSGFITPRDASLGLSTIRVSEAQAHTLGLCLRFARRFTTDQEKPADEKLTEFTDRLEAFEEAFRILGFNSPRLERIGEQFSLSFIPPDRSVCPLPQLGIGIASLQDGAWRVTYRIRFMKDFQSVMSHLNSTSIDPNNTCTLLFCHFPISFDERRQMLESLRSIQTSRDTILLDRSFLRYAVCLPEAERLPAFYACTAHLLRPTPYSTDTEKHWEGTFFGRAKEIEQLLKMNGCSVIYGGRRLGKTSIMREVEYRWLNSAKENLAIYINLQHNNSKHPRLWYHVASALVHQIPELQKYQLEGATSAEVDRDALEIIQILKTFLTSNGARLLLLLDECDDLIYHDTVQARSQADKTCRLHELISLSYDLPGNFRFVLAGLQCATRFVQSLDAYNIVRPNNDMSFQCLSSSVRVQPLLKEDSESAYDLVDIPFRMMGYQLEPRSVLFILRVCCFRPNLIQNYCRQLLDAVRGSRSISCMPDSLYMHVPHSLVTAIHDDASYKGRHLEQSLSIPLNEGVTAVYAPIAYAVALLSLRHSAQGRYVGFSVSEVHNLITGIDPAFTEDMPRAREYINTILTELVYVGVLREIAHEHGTRYALFSSYMLQLLGDSSTIEETLRGHIATQILSQPIDRDRTELFAQRRVINNFVLPMTNGQLEQLYQAMKTRGYAVIAGSAMLHLESVTEMLGHLRFGGRPGISMEMAAKNLADEARREALLADTCDEASQYIVILRGVWPDQLPALLEQLHNQRPNVCFLPLVSPENCMELLDELDAVPAGHIVHLTRLTPTFRVILFESTTDGRYNKTEALRITNLMGELTGDWPELANRFLDLVRTPTEEVSALLRQLYTGSEADREEVAAAFSRLLFPENDPADLKAALGLHVIDPQYWQYLTLENLAEGCEMAAEDGLDSKALTDMARYLQHMDLADVTGHIAEPDGCIIRPSAFAHQLLHRGCNE